MDFMFQELVDIHLLSRTNSNGSESQIYLYAIYLYIIFAQTR